MNLRTNKECRKKAKIRHEQGARKEMEYISCNDLKMLKPFYMYIVADVTLLGDCLATHL